MGLYFAKAVFEDVQMYEEAFFLPTIGQIILCEFFKFNKSSELVQGFQHLREVSTAEDVEVDEQIIQLIDGHPLLKSGRQGVGFSISPVKSPIEAAKKPAHSEVHFPVGKGNGRIDQNRLKSRRDEVIPTP